MVTQTPGRSKAEQQPAMGSLTITRRIGQGFQVGNATVMLKKYASGRRIVLNISAPKSLEIKRLELGPTKGEKDAFERLLEAVVVMRLQQKSPSLGIAQQMIHEDNVDRLVRELAG